MTNHENILTVDEIAATGIFVAQARIIEAAVLAKLRQNDTESLIDRAYQNDNGARKISFLPAGLNRTGKYHMLGKPEKVILVAEDYDTAMTVHKATGHCAVVALDLNNLAPAAQALHQAHPQAHILVCARDDFLIPENPGVTAAQEAAKAAGGSWLKPEFPYSRMGKILVNFHDLSMCHGGGFHVVREQIEKALLPITGPIGKAALIYGPQGCGKTRHANALALFYGKSKIKDYDGRTDPRSYCRDTLVLTNAPLPGAIDFADAMLAAGLNIDQEN